VNNAEGTLQIDILTSGEGEPAAVCGGTARIGGSACLLKTQDSANL
jgi:hypothetical protein